MIYFEAKENSITLVDREILFRNRYIYPKSGWPVETNCSFVHEQNGYTYPSKAELFG
jgi:hypothetical protein